MRVGLSRFGTPASWLRILGLVARHPTMRTPDWRWQVEVITSRGGQSFRVKRLDTLPAAGSSGLPSPGTLVRTIGEVRDLLGDDFERLVEVREQRFGRRTLTCLPPSQCCRCSGTPSELWRAG